MIDAPTEVCMDERRPTPHVAPRSALRPGSWPIAVVVVALVGGWIWWLSDEPAAYSDTPFAPVERVPSVPAPAFESSIAVHITGAVLRPGLVRLAEDARVADAVAAAGGAIIGANLSSLNLAAPVHDGDRIVVQTLLGDGADGAPIADAREPEDDGGVDLNRADAAEMQKLPGVGPVLAERIVAFREANGPFERVEDLLDVPGIGEGKLASLRDAVGAP